MLSSFTGSFAFGRRAAGGYGSVSIPGTLNSFLRVDNTSAFAPGTGDFTIQWWQYPTAWNAFARVFSIGTYGTSPMIAMSFEGPDDNNKNFNMWIEGFQEGSIPVGLTLNTWVHFAVVRQSGTFKLYKNGTNITGAGISMPYDALYDNTDYCVIGAESGNGATCAQSTTFTGQITGLQYVVGSALYSTDFSIPTTSNNGTIDTELLLNFTSRSQFLTDRSNTSKVVRAFGLVEWSPETPF